MLAKATSLAKLCLATALYLIITSQGTALNVWINEIHYDNAGSDKDEFVEIAGTAGVSLNGYSIEFYNGNGGTVYESLPLTGTFSNAGAGYGFIAFLFSGIQNGSPDGIALTDGSDLVQFLSYEGTINAVGGSANLATSIDIGVAESSSTPEGKSLQFTGIGNFGSWAGPVTATPGEVNIGQSLSQTLPRSPTASVPDQVASLSLLGLSLTTLLLFKNRRTKITIS